MLQSTGASRSTYSTALLLCLCLVAQVAAKGFLNVVDHNTSGVSRQDLEIALEHVLGCGGEISSSRLLKIEQSILPVWKVLPKNREGNVGWRSLRYVAHRFFMQQSNLLVRGFEPMRRVNESELGMADILEDRLPSVTNFAEEMGEEKYGLRDAVMLVASIEQLIFDNESALLEKAYQRAQRYFARISSARIPFERLARVLETYMIHWMMGSDHESVGLLLGNESLLFSEFPHWRELKAYVRGEIRAMDFERLHSPADHLQEVFQQGYTFADAHEVVGAITKNFAPFWESECQAIKSSLVALDTAGTGRVRLGDFYGASIDGEWRFGESEAYLRDMGVLDETSTWRGKQVIIPNYIQAASNCIVNTDAYLVCCRNDCEDIMRDIEIAVQSPTASPEFILELVGNMTAHAGEDDGPVEISSTLREQLLNVARHHDGMVPVHGRLFAQWLHYVFPRDCAFPHKVGAVSGQTPSEFGEQALATITEMKGHAEIEGVRSEGAMLKEEDYRATQWSQEEEFIVDYKMHAPWERTSGRSMNIVIVLLLVALVAVHLLSGKWRSQKGTSSLSSELPYATCMKAHMV